VRYAFLVGLREYLENVKTKGFWIGILIFPILILVSFKAQQWLEGTTPTRNFVVVDQSERLSGALEKALERLHQRDVMKALAKYAERHRDPELVPKVDLDLEKIPAIDVQAEIARFQEANPEAIDAFLGAGGIALALEQLDPYLKDDAPEFEEPRRSFRRVELPAGVRAEAARDEIASSLRPFLRGEESIVVDGQPAELFAAVLIPADVIERVVRPASAPLLPEQKQLGIQYWSINLADDDLKDEIQQAVDEEVRRLEYVAKGVDAAKVAEVQRTYVPFAMLNPKKEAGEEAVSLADQLRQWAPIGFVYLLWIAIFSVSQMLLNNTIEEKSNRIIEVLLSSVTPGELMMGKLFGIAAVGVTMLGAWLASLVGILLYYAGPEAEFAAQLLEVLRSSGLIPKFLVYFVFGYLLYAGVFLAIGSVCNTLKEAQNMMGPIMLIMIVPLFTMTFIPKDPNGTLATALSWVPLYTPFVMMNRAAADPPLFDVVGTLALLVVTTGLALWMCGRIFRIGVLRTGQPPKLLELVRWVRG
jgi:ABC-2 type transport system permease protein